MVIKPAVISLFVCFFWTWLACTTFSSILIILKLVTNGNIALISLVIICRENNECNLFTHGALRRSRQLVEKGLCLPNLNGIWKSCLLRRGENRITQRKNLSEKAREPTTNSTHAWLQSRELNLGHISGRRVLSPLRHRIVHGQEALNINLTEPLFSTLMFAGFHNQSPLPTMMCVRNEDFLRQ